MLDIFLTTFYGLYFSKQLLTQIIYSLEIFVCVTYTCFYTHQYFQIFNVLLTGTDWLIKNATGFSFEKLISVFQEAWLFKSCPGFIMKTVFLY